ncbi:MAG: serine protease [bacterium]
MESLNKHQIILLALLVAFVASIATGITVVSLLGQTSQPVVQTINRVVEKTIETITPAQTGNPPKEKTTVVVKDEDLTISAIDKNVKSIVRIYNTLPDGTDLFIADGVVVSDKGYVITDKASLTQSGFNGSYKANLSDGTKISLDTVASNDALGLTLMKAKLSTDQKVDFSPVGWADSEKIKLGQTIIALSLDTKKVVSIGNVASLDIKDGKNISIIADVKITNSVAGAMLFNLSGEVVGMHTSSEKQMFMVSNIIKDAVTALMPK